MITTLLLEQSGFVLEQDDLRNGHLWKFFKTVKSAQGEPLYIIQLTKVRHYFDKQHFDYSAEAVFEAEDGAGFQVELLDVRSVNQLLSFFDRIFKSMNCVGLGVE